MSTESVKEKIECEHMFVQTIRNSHIDDFKRNKDNESLDDG
jgi:hypothetical protein